MRVIAKICACLCLPFLLLMTEAFSQSSSLRGAWLLKQGNMQEVLMFQDGYFTHTRYDLPGRNFLMTRGGTYTTSANKVSVLLEFHSAHNEEVGKSYSYSYSMKNSLLQINLDDKEQNWSRIDDSSAPLAGVWKISERMSDGKLLPIHQTGTRKTLKMLTGTRFHWFAIDPGTKQFSGTGGGTYTFKDGKYTENIEFFSRDNNRVGASLTFDGKLEDGKWHHSGTSSKGDKIYEVWSKRAP